MSDTETRPIWAKDASIARLIWVLTVVGLTLLTFIAMRDPLTVCHDVALFISAGRLILLGRLPYRDFFELNPPLIMYLCVPIVALGKVLGIHAIIVFKVCVLLLTAHCLWQSSRLLNRALSTAKESDIAFIIFGMMVVSLWVWNSNLFGQREHLFLLAYTPFFCARLGRWHGAPPPWAAAVGYGIVAGVIMSIKPHFFITPIAVEVYWAARSRKWRPLLAPETFAMLAMPLLYLAHFALLPDDIMQTFFGRLVPLVAHGYSAYNVPLGRDFVSQQFGYLAVLALCAVVGHLLRRFTALSPLFWPAVVFTVAAVFMYVAQHKGWIQHRLPVALGLVVLAGVALSAASGWMSSWPRGRVYGHCLLAAILLFGCWRAMSPRGPKLLTQSQESLLQRIVQLTHRWDGVMILSTSVTPAYPLLEQTDRLPCGHFLWAFPLPMLYLGQRGELGQPFPYRSQPGSEQERLFVADLVEDLVQRKPTVVVIQQSEGAQGLPPNFIIFDYVSHMIPLHHALAGYRLDGRVQEYAVFVRAL